MKMMRLLAVVPSLVLSLSLATSAHADNLLDIYKLAQQNDPTLKAAAEGHNAALTSEPQARALYYPSVDASANAGRSHYKSSSVTNNYSTHGYTLSLTQPVFHYGNIVQNRQAKYTVDRADAQYAAAQQDLMIRVAQAYFNVLSAEDGLEFARSEKGAIKRQLEQAQKRFDVGMVAITDVHEAKAAYDSAAAREIAAKNAVSAAEEALREITNRYTENLAKLGDKMPLVSPDPANLDSWTKTALKQNLQLLAAGYAADEARQSIDLQRAGNYPTLDVVAQRNSSYSGGGLFPAGTRDTDSINLQLSMNLYQGGLTRLRTKQYNYLYNQAREQQEVQRRATLRQTRDAYRGVLTGISQVEALKQAVVSNQSALDATEAGFEVGTRTIVDVLLAQSNLFGAKRNYAQSRYDYILNTLKLKQAAGTLSLDDLAQINSWMQ